MGQFGERINLVHELRQLAPAKEIANHGGKRLRVDELLRRHGFNRLVEQCHALLHQAFRAGQTHTALVGQQFTHGTDAAAAQMINVIQRTFALFELEQILRCRNQIFFGQDAAVAFHAQFLIDLVTAHATEVIAFFVEEQTFDERTGIRRRGRITRAQTAVNILERLDFILGRIFLEALDHVALVHRGVHDLDLGDTEFANLLDDGLRQRLKRARHDEAFFLIRDVVHEHAILQIFNLLGFLHRQFFDGVEQLQDFFVRAAQ